jgi:hypothetical protein
MTDLEKFANVSMPRIFGSEQGQDPMLQFYGIDCLAVRNDMATPDFLTGMYSCYDWSEAVGGKAIVNTKNYKYKKGVPSLMSFVVLRLFQFLKIPPKINLFRKEVNVEEELEFVE